MGGGDTYLGQPSSPSASTDPMGGGDVHHAQPSAPRACTAESKIGGDTEKVSPSLGVAPGDTPVTDSNGLDVRPERYLVGNNLPPSLSERSNSCGDAEAVCCTLGSAQGDASFFYDHKSITNAALKLLVLKGGGSSSNRFNFQLNSAIRDEDGSKNHVEADALMDR